MKMYILYLFSNTSKSHFRWAATLRARSFKMRFLLLSGGGWTWFCSFTEGFEACSKNWTISCTGGGSAKKHSHASEFGQAQKLIQYCSYQQRFSCHLYSWHYNLPNSHPKGYLAYSDSNQAIKIYLTFKFTWPW